MYVANASQIDNVISANLQNLLGFLNFPQTCKIYLVFWIFRKPAKFTWFSEFQTDTVFSYENKDLEFVQKYRV
jgi:hypothetical protein